MVVTSAMITLLRICCHGGHCCDWQVSQLVRTIGCVSPPRAVKTRSQGGGFQVRSNLATPSPVSEVLNIFCNRHLLPASGRQTKVIAIANIVLEVSWTPSPNNSVIGSCLLLGLC